ncbi:hypothetical protein SAY87_004138 [Trapa incisa]|uniref:Uncharacterized protein n=1 Tax=Trapa incisa TaxID=236973 RepID=A0AAN7JN93_9MYRT|nr:hypothetical protein SAY87_004138 [Trapa incisa]
MAVAVPGLHVLHGDSIRMKVRGDSVPKPGQLFVLSHSGMYVILCNVSSVEGRHLDFTFGNPETIDDIKLLRSQVEEDLVKGVAGAVPIPPNVAGKEEVSAAVVSNVDAMIKADCGLETTAGLHIFHPKQACTKLIFGNTNHGDLRKYLCGHFDTAVGTGGGGLCSTRKRPASTESRVQDDHLILRSLMDDTCPTSIIM